MKSVLDALMYERAISNDKSDAVTHSVDFFAPDKSIFRKKILFRNILKIAHIVIFFSVFFYDSIYKNSTPRLIK